MVMESPESLARKSGGAHFAESLKQQANPASPKTLMAGQQTPIPSDNRAAGEASTGAEIAPGTAGDTEAKASETQASMEAAEALPSLEDLIQGSEGEALPSVLDETSALPPLEELARLMSADSVAVREETLELIGRQRILTAAALVVGALEADAGPLVRRAAWALGKLRPELTPELTARLVALLGHGDDLVRAEVAEALGRLGPLPGEIVDRLVAIVENTEESAMVQRWAVWSLGRGATNQEPVALLFAGLLAENRDWIVRRELVEGLGKLQVAKAAVWQVLETIRLEEEDEELAERAAESMVALGLLTRESLTQGSSEEPTEPGTRVPDLKPLIGGKAGGNPNPDREPILGVWGGSDRGEAEPEPSGVLEADPGAQSGRQPQLISGTSRERASSQSEDDGDVEDSELTDGR
jgi:HEAT repeat protein